MGYDMVWLKQIILAHIWLNLLRLEVATELLTQGYLRPDSICKFINVVFLKLDKYETISRITFDF